MGKHRHIRGLFIWLMQSLNGEQFLNITSLFFSSTSLTAMSAPVPALKHVCITIIT